MKNDALSTRLDGIQKSLVGMYGGGGGVSSASRGQEREQFIKTFLREVMPPGYRFGTGDAIDTHGNQSGQLDIVVEFTFLPSLPLVSQGPRIYLAEGIAAVLEVKSNVAAQWNEVVETATRLRALRRVFQVPGFTPFGPPSETIPLFAVGYTGWKSLDTLIEKANSGVVDGILIVDEGLFSSRKDYPNGLHVNNDSAALWALVCCLHAATTSVFVNSFSPVNYLL